MLNSAGGEEGIGLEPKPTDEASSPPVLDRLRLDRCAAPRLPEEGLSLKGELNGVRCSKYKVQNAHRIYLIVYFTKALTCRAVVKNRFGGNGDGGGSSETGYKKMR